ncbi:MAG: hypothetical protein B7Z71_13265 [Acidocella sp. 21-58-7]|nr:MAG: hypothetical protein B7Z71_13265 [Acidocella sp. 21-58-7]
MFRQFLFLIHELRVLGFLGNKRAQKLAQHMAVSHIHKTISDPALRAKVTPNYKVGCKRVMISNDYYPTLTRPNVDVITDNIAEIRAQSVIDVNGVERPADAIIFGTGFEVTSAYKHWNIQGIGGQDLKTLWDKTGMRSFKGVSIAGFPNLFLLLGPHTALGHNSVVIMIEAQVGYIVDALKQARAKNAAALNAKAASQAAFIAEISAKLKGTVWQDGGCQSWYQDEHGFVSTIWPGSAASYQKTMRAADLQDFELLATETAKVNA